MQQRMKGVVLVLAALVHTGLALQCYKCSSKENNACHDPFTKHPTLDTVDCPPLTIREGVRSSERGDGSSAFGGEVCYTAVIETVGEDIPHIERGCGLPDYCQTRHVTARLVECRTCVDELCNSAPRHLKISLIVVPLAFVLKYF